MPTSAIGKPQSAGFSLVELLAALAILALASATVVMAWQPGKGAVRAEAERFAARVSAARDRAIIGGRPVQVTVSAAGYGFAERRDGAWVVIPGKALAATLWAKGVKAGTVAEVVFEPVGSVEGAATIALEGEGQTARVRIDGGGGAHVAP